MGKRFIEVVRKNLFGVITMVISIAVLLVFLLSSDGINSLNTVSKNLQAHWLLWALAAVAGTWIFDGIALNLLCKVVYPDWKFNYSFCIGLVGVLYSALTPFATAGSQCRYTPMHRLGMDTGAAGSIIAIRTLVYQVVLVLYSLVMVIWKLPFFQNNVSSFSFLTVFGLICNSTFICLVLLFSISERMTDKLLKKGVWLFHKLHLCKHPEERYEKIRSELSVFHGSSSLLRKSWKAYLGACLMTFLQFTAAYMIPYLVYRSFGFSEQPVSVMMAAQAYVSMVSAFIPLPGASGGAEGSFVLFFGAFFENGTIIPAMVLWRTISYYLNFPIGVICTYFSGRMRKLSLRQTQES